VRLVDVVLVGNVAASVRRVRHALARGASGSGPAALAHGALGLCDSCGYGYDPDGVVRTLTLPDGSHVAITLDASGRPESMALSAGMLHLGYDNTTGLLSSAMMPNAVGDQGLALTYDGPLLTQQRYTGVATADVDYAYDDLLRVSSVRVAGEATAYSYDRDGLVTSAGAETLTRDPDSGVVTATTVCDALHAGVIWSKRFLSRVMCTI